jgi:hypothetical protein
MPASARNSHDRIPSDAPHFLHRTQPDATMKLLRGLRRKQKHTEEAVTIENDFTELKTTFDQDMGSIVEEAENRMVEEVDEREEEPIRSEERDEVRESPREKKSISREEKRQRKNKHMREMLADGEKSFLDMACENRIDMGACTDVVNEKPFMQLKKTAQQKHTEYKSGEDGAFDFMCGTLETACGIEGETPKTPKTLKMYKVVKSHPKEKVGLSFVAFKGNSGIYICKIKEGSKFLGTGLKVGMRVAIINGQPCPKRVGQLMKVLKGAQNKVEIVAEMDRSYNRDVSDDKSTGAGSAITDDMASTVYDEDTVWSGDSNSSGDSQTYQRMEKDGNMAMMMDMLLGQHTERSKEAKEKDNFANNMSYIVGNMKNGAPLWMFLE